jgi:Arc/MetJ-type ribon-helix-helix transcriptional regulator
LDSVTIFNPYAGKEKKKMADTEKITINMNVVDLGKIDLLVDRGFYSNRTDFIKASIRDLLNDHAEDVRKGVDWNVWSLGLSGVTRKDLEKKQRAGQKGNIFVVGMLVVTNDVTPELFLATVKACKVYGVIRASDAIKAAIETLEE